jgi:hypothetical protein
MRNYINPRKLISFILMMMVLILLSCWNLTQAQDGKPLRIYLDIMCYQKSSGIDLKATVRARIGENRKIMPVPQIPVNFYNIADTSEVFLGSALSNERGESVYSLLNNHDILRNHEGGFSFSAVIDGSEKFRKATKKISIKEARIEISFAEIDSVKVIDAKAFALDSTGTLKEPINGIDLSFYVPGSFSLFKIADAELIDGVCNVEFPVTLPGDSEGNLTIIAKIEESDDYGFVEGSAVKDWGMIRESIVPEKSRGLGDTDAPLWMVYTLIFLMSAVWIHYIYVFVVIYLIKKDSKTMR